MSYPIRDKNGKLVGTIGLRVNGKEVAVSNQEESKEAKDRLLAITGNQNNIRK